MIVEGTRIGDFEIGPPLGRGTFGYTSAANDLATGALVALKIEMPNPPRKTVEFEAHVLRGLHRSEYTPDLLASGIYQGRNWIVTPFAGPSLDSAVRALGGTLSLSSGLRAALFILRGIRDIHNSGFVHRDIKPSNILLRVSGIPPICICDFGSARYFIDRGTGKHAEPRKKVSFRGTKMFASINSHKELDLSRRDDLFSWFYTIHYVLFGGLPWEGINSSIDILAQKVHFFPDPSIVELPQIWSHIQSLGFEDEPDYDMIETLLCKAMDRKGIKMEDPYDWESYLIFYREELERECGLSSGCTEELPPPRIGSYSYKKLRKGTDVSLSMPLSEINEGVEKGCCC